MMFHNIIDLSNSAITKVPDLSYYECLEEVILVNCKVHDNIDNLYKLPSTVTKLNLSCCEITNIDFSRLPSGLKKLYLSGNNIKNFDNLPNQLELLQISDNPVEQLDHLPLTLKKLDCDRTYVKSLDFLPSNLEQLFCNKCYFIKSLDNLPQSLKLLQCTYCPIETFENLPEQLFILDTSCTKCIKIENLPKNLYYCITNERHKFSSFNIKIENHIQAPKRLISIYCDNIINDTLII